MSVSHKKPLFILATKYSVWFFWRNFFFYYQPNDFVVYLRHPFVWVHNTHTQAWICVHRNNHNDNHYWEISSNQQQYKINGQRQWDEPTRKETKKVEWHEWKKNLFVISTYRHWPKNKYLMDLMKRLSKWIFIRRLAFIKWKHININIPFYF